MFILLPGFQINRFSESFICVNKNINEKEFLDLLAHITTLTNYFKDSSLFYRAVRLFCLVLLALLFFKIERITKAVKK